MAFTNPQVDVNQLPSVDEVVLQPVAPAYLNVIQISTFLVLFFFGGASMLFFFLIDEMFFFYLSLGISISLLIGALSYNPVRFRKMGYAIRAKDIIFRRGVLSIQTTVVPFNRIQHVTIDEGIIMRMYGLAALRLFTAGGAKSDLNINGLLVDDAVRIKDYLNREIGNEPEH